MDTLFAILVLLFSVSLHEAAHAYAARFEGDMTASSLGRLSPNPIKHLDPIGSFVVPFATYILGGFFLGWAKPVPINPSVFRHRRWGEAIVAFAGPLSNIVLAAVFAFFIRIGAFAPEVMPMVGTVVFINILLACFNLIPVPPLDGSRVLTGIFPSLRSFFWSIERFGILLPLILAVFIWRFIFPFSMYLFKMFVGA